MKESKQSSNWSTKKIIAVIFLQILVFWLAGNCVHAKFFQSPQTVAADFAVRMGAKINPTAEWKLASCDAGLLQTTLQMETRQASGVVRVELQSTLGLGWSAAAYHFQPVP